MTTVKYKAVRANIIKITRKVVAILGFIGAINGLLVVVVDEESALGRFYEKSWYNYVLGHNYRENVYNPFQDGSGSKYIIYFDVLLSKDDIEDIQSKSDYRVYTFSKVYSYNNQVPQGILTFSSTQYEAFRIADIMIEKRESLTYARDDGVEVTQMKASTIPNDKLKNMEEFCDEYKTFEPEQLCF